MVASVNGNVPLNYEEVILSADAEKWQAAMQKEFKSLLENKTWVLVALPSGKPSTKGKWAFDTKRKAMVQFNDKRHVLWLRSSLWTNSY